MILNHLALFPRRFPSSQSFSTRSLVKLSKWLFCSSVNFLQNREESDCRAETLTGPDTSLSKLVGALTGPSTSPSNLIEERKLLTFSVLAIFSLESGMSFLCSALIRWSFKTTSGISACISVTRDFLTIVALILPIVAIPSRWQVL